MTDCIFCRIVRGEIPAKIFLEHKDYLVFHDINPQAPVHLLLIPRLHIPSLNDLEDSNLAASLLQGCREAARLAGLTENGYRLVTNIGSHGGQTVYHLHFHILGGRHLGWPPG